MHKVLYAAVYILNYFNHLLSLMLMSFMVWEDFMTDSSLTDSTYCKKTYGFKISCKAPERIRVGIHCRVNLGLASPTRTSLLQSPICARAVYVHPYWGSTIPCPELDFC